MKSTTSDTAAVHSSRALLHGLAVVIATAHSTSAQVSVGTLADELADRDTLAIFPEQQFEQLQASSHDTRNALGFSRLGAPWGSANIDFGNYLRSVSMQGRTELVLMEDDGPGVITRWWTTGIDQQLLDNHHLRVYVDGEPEPVIEATAEELVGGNNAGFGDRLNFATPEIGGNLYAPIPYRRGVLVTWDGPLTHGHPHVAQRDPELKNSIDNALWYNINYRRLPESADVQSYARGDVEAFRDRLERANEQLAELQPSGAITSEHRANQALASGASVGHTLSGPGAVRRIQVNIAAEDEASALADCLLVLRFDGVVTSRVPLGQFFGNGLSESDEKAYNAGADCMRSIAEDGTMLSLWVMPYRESAEIRVENTASQEVEVTLEIDSGDWSWNDHSMHFHADYVFEAGVQTRQKPGGPWPGEASKRHLYSAEGDGDFRFIDIRGKGVFVGDTMSIRNQTTGDGLNSWWGEGDEKIYVDYLSSSGDGSSSKPLHLGTGTEDYYGYSFGSGQEFATPFVTMPIAAGNRSDNGGVTVQGRVRRLDTIPFEQSLKFDMEIWKWRQGELDLAAATFWYGRPGAVSLHTVADLAADLGEPQKAQQGAGQREDSAGDGHWRYLSSTHANPQADGASTAELSWGKVGGRGAEGFGGGTGSSGSLPAIATGFIEEAGLQNIGVHGGLGYHEVAVHPAGGEGVERPYVVARWTAGESSAGLVNVGGAVRNLVGPTGDSVDFYVYVDGQLAFKSDENAADASQLPEVAFDFDRTIKAGQSIDFVVGNGGLGDSTNDETVLRAIIRSGNK